MSGPPPGYEDASSQERLALAGPASVAALCASALALTAYELGIADPEAYTPFDAPSQARWILSAGLAAGVALGYRTKTPATRAVPALATLALLAAAAGHAWVFAFAHGRLLLTLEVLLPALTGVLSGYAALVLGRGVGRHFAVLGVFAYLLNALRLCLLGGAWLLLLMMLPLLPVPQRGALLSALLTLAALLLERFQRLCGPTPRAAWAAQSVIAIAPFAALGSLGLAERALPREALRSHAGEVVYALDGPRGHHVVSRLQGGLVLFSGEMLALTSADAPRFAESLAHPALAVARRRRAVLVLDDGTGSVEREVLRWRDVERLTLVPHDPSLLRLAKHSLWFQRLGADALADSRVQEVPTEAAPFVLNSRESFDVILVNMGDPSSFLEGKYYTVGFLEALRLRLAPGGVLGMQVTSPLRTPETYASVLSTLTHAGFNIIPYVAPLPTLGEWGFVVAFSGEAPARTALAAASAALPHGTRFITPAVLAALFAAPASATGDARDSHLYDQPCVETYQREERALSD